jgi:nitroreductase
VYEPMTAPFDLAQTDKLLTTTRAVRKRLDLGRPVPRDLIVECVGLATQAPAGANIQRWRWVIVDDPAKKAAIAELYQRAYAPYIEMQRNAVAETGRSDGGAIMASSDYLAQVLAEVPALVIPCQLGRVEAGQTNQEVSGWYGSILPAVWSFMLAARSRGLGTAWTTLHLKYEFEAADILGIPHSVTQVALTPVAYYTGDDFKPASRVPAEKVVYANEWKNAV